MVVVVEIESYAETKRGVYLSIYKALFENLFFRI